jgi:hypothetical protein
MQEVWLTRALVLRYIYLIPRMEYNDDEAAKRKEVVCAERYDMEKYILSFMSVADR